MEDTTSPNIIELDADSTNSPLTSTFEDGHESVTTPEPEEDDGYESFADNDESSASNNSDEEEDDGDDDRSSVASDSSELPSEYIIHDDEALEDCKYFTIRYSVKCGSLKANNGPHRCRKRRALFCPSPLSPQTDAR
jgi:hypothetical protein